MKNIHTFFSLKITIASILLLTALALLIGIATQVTSQFLTVEERLSYKIFSFGEDRYILKGEEIVGNFTAKYSDLGTVAVRFYTKENSGTDKVLFSLKEKNASSWNYKQEYSTSQFLNDDLFPFGFPVIADSSGKEYTFRIQSLQGTEETALRLSPHDPSIVIRYQITESSLLRNPGYTISFLYSKLAKAFSESRNVFIAFAPLVIFCVFRLVIAINVQKTGSILLRLVKWTTVISLLLLPFGYIFLLGKLLPGDETNSIQVLGFIFLLWLFFVIRYKFAPSIWYGFGLGFLVIMMLSSIIRRPDFGDRAATIGYCFLMIGILHSWLSYRFPKQYESFFVFLKQSLRKPPRKKQTTKKKKYARVKV